VSSLELCVIDGIADFGVPQATEWQRIGDQIDAAFIFARGVLRKRV
jgi:hypothetical protein